MASKLFSSSIFKHALTTALVFIFGALFLGFVFGWLLIESATADLQGELKEHQQLVQEIYADAGLSGLNEEFELENFMLWSKEETQERLNEDELAYAMVDVEGKHIAGSRLFMPTEQEWHWQTIELEDDSVPCLVLSFALNDRISVALVRAQSHEHWLIKETLMSGAKWLVVIVIPLALVIGYALSRSVFKRINMLSQTLEHVSENPMSHRVTVSDKNDEFDRLALNINSMLDEIATLHQNIETMSVGLAHDLKTPLARISNRLQLMSQDIENPDILSMHLDNANQQLSSVITTFQGMIRLSEIESGRQKQYFKQVNLSELLSEISESYEPVFTDQHRELEISVVDNVYCMGDQDLLNQLVCNLLENSLEHGRQNGKTWLRLQSHRKGALLQIGDDGPGISPQHRHHIFERFYRADISRGKEGNGLGLSIVKAICSLHEGQISLLENQQGAVFDIELPTQTRT